MSETLSMPQDLPPFGWYPDPDGSGKLRWWNGHEWTDRLETPRAEIHPSVVMWPGNSTGHAGAHKSTDML